MPPPPLLIYVRHGEREDKYGVVCEKHNPSLTPEGFSQAQGAGALIQRQHPGVQWTIYSSPFARALQTAFGISSQLNQPPQRKALHVDFELGEHIVNDGAIPASTRQLDEAAANEIVSQQAARARLEAVPAVLISYGDGSCLVPDSRAESGQRLMRAMCRIYDQHVRAVAAASSGSGGEANDDKAATGIICVSHGFGPTEMLMTQCDGAVRVERVYLCAMMGLQRNAAFSVGASSPLFPVHRLPSFSAPAQAAAADPQQGGTTRTCPSSSSPLLVTWSRGVKWVNLADGTSNISKEEPEIGMIEQHRDPVEKTFYEPRRICQVPPFLAYGAAVDLPPK
jgi:broad specificity phosphatase PhoE